MHTTLPRKLDQWVVSFVTTAASCLLWPILPPAYSLPIIFLLAVAALHYQQGYWLSGALFGVLWMASVGHWLLYWQLSAEQISQITAIHGQVVSIGQDQNPQKFTLAANSIQLAGKKHQSRYPIRVKLSWLDGEFAVKQGMELVLKVKLKPAHGLANTGSMDYLQWLRAAGIVATGYVKQHPDNCIVSSHTTHRQRLIDLLSNSALQHRQWIAALALGDKSKLTKQDWLFVQQMGIAHLVAISGLHLSVVAMLGFVVFRLIFQAMMVIFTVSQSLNLQRLSLIPVLLLVAYYAYLAGFSLPTSRALIAFLVFSVLHWHLRHWSAAKKLLYCIGILILVMPLSLLSASFWFSVCAVTVILFYLWRWPVITRVQPLGVGSRIIRWLSQLVKLQLFICVLMLPLSLYIFNGFSTVSALTNLVAIPYVSLLLVPLCLISITCLIFSLPIAQSLLNVTDSLIGWGINALHMFPFEFRQVSQVPTVPVLMSLLAIVLLFAPRFQLRILCIMLLLVPVLTYQLPVRNHHWQLHVLDVGQGLAVVVERKQHALVYDVGSHFPSGFNMADAVILPFLQAKGIRHVDYLIISHFDNDHAGAKSALLEGINVTTQLSSRQGCHRGWQMQWQGLTVQSLWPQKGHHSTKNDSSCVITISDGVHRVLLTGDISKAVEAELLRLGHSQLRADVMVAPHHGSNTSSSAAFIAAVSAKIVIFSQGFLNRWNFPAQKVVNRYVKSEARLYATSDVGQITVGFANARATTTEHGEPAQMSVQTYRQHLKPYWYSR